MENLSGKSNFGRRRSDWVQEVYDAVVNYMKDVRLTFPNYTLHDETHIRNVIDAIGGLLGDWIHEFTVGGLELMILTACLHDIGMVYTGEEKQKCFQDKESCRVG